MVNSTEGAPGEQDLLETVQVDGAWALLEEFSHLVRESGTEDERRAVERITNRLEAWGVPHTVHEPELWISLPREAALTVDGRTYPAKTPSMAASTPEGGRTAPVVYLPAAYARSVNDLFFTGATDGEVAGKLVVTEGMPMPGKVAALEAKGALGVICVAPGERIHEGICTSIWGAPDLTTWGRQPKIPVVSVSNPDGRAIAAQIGAEARATIVARHDTSWRRIPVVVAELRGSTEPDRFVLLHGHLDSWHVGIGDNATGDATLLEVARAIGQRRDGLRRSVRVCWWSGHSHGRYAGSTWYADAFANDLARNCVCHLNCDSPGCRDATVFQDVYWMAELEDFAKRAIRDFVGLPASGRPPIRAGDISFNNLGVSTCFMLTSTMPDELRQQRGLYAVGGCGGNIEWHTEADTMEIADRDHLLRDIRLYAGATFRAANLPVHPLDFRRTLDQIQAVLDEREPRLGGAVDLAPVRRQLTAARRALDRLHEAAAPLRTVEEAAPVNRALLRAGRALVPVLYSREGRYRQDPALDVPALPDLAAVAEARGTVPEGVLRTEAMRARNRLEGALLDVQAAVDEVGV
jgi:N-acetylated-alpha-linked acidic dipeptidase